MRRFLGTEHEGAHQAREDVRVTLAVYARMRELFALSHQDAMRLTHPDHELDRDGKFVVNEQGEVAFNFGKHQGKPVSMVERSYLEWMARDGSFKPSTKAVVQRLLVEGPRLPESAARRRSPPA